MSMFRIEKNKENPYVMLNKLFLQDERLSAKAKGILAYFLSLPDDWQFYETEIAKHFSDGVKSINVGIKELIKYHYIIREQNRNEKGRFGSYTYCVYEVPTETPFSELGEAENREMENRKEHTTNTD